MQPGTDVATLALFNLGGGEVVLILALVIILLMARLPELTRRLLDGTEGFLKATRKLRDEVHEQSHDAGRSVGGIYGKPAMQALTPDNRVAEMYDPAANENKRPAPKPRTGVMAALAELLRWIRRLLSR